MLIIVLLPDLLRTAFGGAAAKLPIRLEIARAALGKWLRNLDPAEKVESQERERIRDATDVPVAGYVTGGEARGHGRSEEVSVEKEERVGHASRVTVAVAVAAKKARTYRGSVERQGPRLNLPAIVAREQQQAFLRPKDWWIHQVLQAFVQ